MKAGRTLRAQRNNPIVGFDSDWGQPPDSLLLPGDEIHIWRASLNQPDEIIQRLRSTLSADEINHADRLLRSDELRNFIAARGILRSILGRYLDLAPDEVTFSYTRYGKPVLRPVIGQKPLGFNVSHSNGLVLYIVAPHLQVGIDVERARPDLQYGHIVDQFFAPAEVVEFHLLPKRLRCEAFYFCWTCKEAFVKAIGEGLWYSLDQFVVSVDPTTSPRLLQTNGLSQTIPNWFLFRLRPARNYFGTLAIEGSSWRIAYWQFPA